jgi:CBS domain-containing protein
MPLRRVRDDRAEVSMSRVADILGIKGVQVHAIDDDATVFDAIRKMVQYDIGALIVNDRDGIAGIFTERDHLRRVTLAGRDARTTAVREVMTTALICVEPHTSVGDCMAMMTRERIRHLPVVQDGDLVGLVSIGDLVKHMASEREVEIRYLTEYITGGPSVL